MNIDFYFDFLSPFSYLANHRLSPIAQDYGVTIRYHAIDLAKAKAAIGNTGPTNRDLKVKLEYLKIDLQRWAEMYRISLAFPPNFNSKPMNIGLYFPGVVEKSSAYVDLVFDAVWGQGVAPDSEELPPLISEKLGFECADFQAFITSAAGEECYEKETQAAINRKVFGVPTMFLGDEMWWGNDRLFMLEETLEKTHQ
jgi:2-hydroxychromene-2-carboxylate isomerase